MVTVMLLIITYCLFTVS